MSENFNAEWSLNIEGDDETKVAKVATAPKVTGVIKRKNLYRVMGLSAPLLAVAAILAFAQPPSTSLSASKTQVNSTLSTNIQSTVAPATSKQQSTPVTLKSSEAIKSIKVKKTTPQASTSTQNTHLSTNLTINNLTIKKPTISGSVGGDDSDNG